MSLNETKLDLLKDLNLEENFESDLLDTLIVGNSRFVKDLRVNLKNVINVETLSQKEAYLLALSVAYNEKNDVLIKSFKSKAVENEATEADVAETLACTSLLSTNNIFYRFRHFAGKETYNTTPARIKMNIMMNPVTGKEFFELMSLVVSAVNGCEMCVKSHEESVIKHGGNEQRIFDAIRLSAVVKGLTEVIR